MGCHLGCQESCYGNRKLVRIAAVGVLAGLCPGSWRRWVVACFSCQWPYWVLLEDRDPGHVPVLPHL